MTVDEARKALACGEPDVVFRSGCATCPPEPGRITRVSGDWVFVDYGQGASQCTNPADLTPVTPEQAQRREWRASLRSRDSDG